MRSKENILYDCESQTYLGKNKGWSMEAVDRALVIEVLVDIRDEQVSLHKTLSALLAGLLVPKQEQPVKGQSLSGADAYQTPYKGGNDD